MYASSIERIKVKVKRLYALVHSFLDSLTDEEKRDLVKLILIIALSIVAVLIVYFYGIPMLQPEAPKPPDPHMTPLAFLLS